VFPSTAALDATTLWAAHAHLITVLDDTPRLAFVSPEYGSGKSRALEILELLVPSPMLSLNASTAAIFRSLAKDQRTLLFDEVDAIFGRRGQDDSGEDLRALLNAGYRKGATIPRCVGPSNCVVDFPVFAAVALASKGDLPESIMTRSIVVRMKRRLPSETISRFRRPMDSPEGYRIRQTLATWCSAIAEAVSAAVPEMPEGVEDRAEDVWAPLVAIADVAQGHWPETARNACRELVESARRSDPSLGVKLLGDLRSAFGEDLLLSTEEILTRLHAMEESPWASLHGQLLSARGLAHLLRPYGVASTKVKFEGRALQGYRRADLWDAFSRYLPCRPQIGEPEEPKEPVT
jgi:hypothetical protein